MPSSPSSSRRASATSPLPSQPSTARLHQQLLQQQQQQQQQQASHSPPHYGVNGSETTRSNLASDRPFYSLQHITATSASTSASPPQTARTARATHLAATFAERKSYWDDRWESLQNDLQRRLALSLDPHEDLKEAIANTARADMAVYTSHRELHSRLRAETQCERNYEMQQRKKEVKMLEMEAQRQRLFDEFNRRKLAQFEKQLSAQRQAMEDADTKALDVALRQSMYRTRVRYEDEKRAVCLQQEQETRREIARLQEEERVRQEQAARMQALQHQSRMIQTRTGGRRR